MTRCLADQFTEDGFIVVPDVLTPPFVDRAKHELMQAIESDSRQYGARAARDYAMVLLCSLHGGAFLDLFDNDPLMEPFNAVLGEECIAYAYTSSSMPPNGRNYSTRIHTDCPRIISGYVTNMGATILLDDFTAENGATTIVPGSHLWESGPPVMARAHAEKRPAVIKAGSALVFPGTFIHGGGANRSNAQRLALTYQYCEGWLRQQENFFLAVPRDIAKTMSPRLQELLGYSIWPPFMGMVTAHHPQRVFDDDFEIPVAREPRSV